MSEIAKQSILVPDWDLPPGVKAFYSSRHGGESLSPYKSFNIANHVGDDPMDVDFNRQQLPMHDHIAWLNQIHGTRCVEADSQYFLSMEPAKADASYTSLANVVCAVMTADCLPILLAAKDASCVSAVHAGWRGLASGVVQNTMTMLDSDPSNITMWVGPHISQKHYEVGEDVKQAFAAFDFAFSQKSEDSYYCNLFAITQAIAHSLGVKDVVNSQICTYEQKLDFYSHRYASQHGKPATGRFVSGVYIEA